MAEPRWSVADRRYLRKACSLARQAAGRTSPNPIVGAVIVRQGRIVGQGFHRFAGSDHAEIVALKQAGPKAKGATLYITLEPCSHFGRTPPCTAAVIRSGISEVVAGMKDPNPLVAGRGFRQLNRAGIKTRVGLLEDECQELLEAFSKYITRRQPFVLLKLAATLDGRIATATGDSKWISNEASRAKVHQLRNELDGVLIGVETAMADDPELTCRLPGGRNPWRIILDSRLRISIASQLLRHADVHKTIVATDKQIPLSKVAAVKSCGATVWQFPLQQGRIPWRPLLRKLAATGIVSIMIEGGATTAASALRAKIVDKVMFFYGPKIIGGDGRFMIDSLAIRRMSKAVKLRKIEIGRVGDDVTVTGYL